MNFNLKLTLMQIHFDRMLNIRYKLNEAINVAVKSYIREILMIYTALINKKYDWYTHFK